MKFFTNRIYILIFSLLTFSFSFAKTNSNVLAKVDGLIQDPPPPPTPPPGVPIDGFVWVLVIIAIFLAVYKIKQFNKNIKKTTT